MPATKFIPLILLLTVCSQARAQRTETKKIAPTEPKHLTLARQLVAHLDLANTNYEHGTPSVKFTDPCEAHADCSGFADALLQQAYGLDKDQFRKIFNSSRPSARRYHDTIQEEHGFQQINRVSELKPGDFLAVKYFNRKDNTGHVMLAAGQALRMNPAKEPVVAGTVQWELKVIDSSESGHGPADTRHAKGPDGKDHDGVGEGVLRIYSDADEKIMGFAWSTVAASKFKSPDDEHLAIGRFLPEGK
jgi:NlpC/P60 family